MGRLPKQPADYIIMIRGATVLLEVKEEKRPAQIAASRLTQTPKMKRFVMAGGQGYFIIYHYELNLWRLFEVGDVVQRTGTVKLEHYNVFETIKELFDTLVPLIELLHRR